MNARDLWNVRRSATEHVVWLQRNLPNVYNGLMQNLVVNQQRQANTLGFILGDGFDISSLFDSVPNPTDVTIPTVDFSSIVPSAADISSAANAVTSAAPNVVTSATDSSGGLFSGLVDSVSNLLSSGGVKTLLNAATPFLNNVVQAQALGTQLTQLHNGLPVTIAGTTTPMATQPLKVTAAGAISQLSSYMPLILLGGGALILMNLLTRKK